MIRQAISCDICASEKKQTNHWFVAYECAGELRVGGWNSRNRLRPGSKHLCGQTCLHKLVDDFMARLLASKVQPAAMGDAEVEKVAAQSDASLTSDAAYVEIESSARLITPPLVVTPKRPLLSTPMELMPLAPRLVTEEAEPELAEPPRIASRNWRVEAWEREREREREMRAGNHHAEIAVRRRRTS